MKEVHFHGPVGTYVDGGQSHQFTTNQTINSGLGIGELMGEIAKHAQELPSADNFQLDQVLKDLQAAAGQPKADKVKLREGLTSAKHIFEHAAGAFIAHGAPTWLPTLVHQIDHFLHSL